LRYKALITGVWESGEYKELEGIGQLVSDLVFTLLSWMVDEERKRIRANQQQGIEVAKAKGKYKGRSLKYHNAAIGKDKIIYDKVIEMLRNDESVMDVHRKTGLSRTTITRIKQEWLFEHRDNSKTLKK